LTFFFFAFAIHLEDGNALYTVSSKEPIIAGRFQQKFKLKMSKKINDNQKISSVA